MTEKELTKENQKAITILSLFDGMSCGQLALQRAGISYDKYFASEIDKHAIKVTQHNFPNTINLGDVTQIKGEDLPKINLLLGGSPCQGFSFAGKQLNFEDERSKLFFEFVRLLKETKPKYFLLENVKMKKESQDVITQYLGVEPIAFNSNLVSAQNRDRLYWTNIEFNLPNDKGIEFESILDDLPFRDIPKCFYEKWGNKQRIYKGINWIKNKKANCLTTKNCHPNQYLFNEDKSLCRLLNANEFERLQTVPKDYTKIVSNTERYKMLGNGWTVDVIAHIFNGLNVMKKDETNEEFLEITK